MDSIQQHYIPESTKIIEHLKVELGKLQTGRAHAGLVEDIHIEVWGTPTPIKSAASISVPEPRTISIQPWDNKILGDIAKAIQIADIGVNPSNNGTAVILNFPPLTEERRKDIVKIVKKLGEEAKIAIRQARQQTMTDMKKEELPEDQMKGQEKKLQEKVDASNGLIDEMVAKKEKEILTI